METSHGHARQLSWDANVYPTQRKQSKKAALLMAFRSGSRLISGSWPCGLCWLFLLFGCAEPPVTPVKPRLQLSCEPRDVLPVGSWPVELLEFAQADEPAWKKADATFTITEVQPDIFQ